jgi:hypothetical protein
MANKKQFRELVDDYGKTINDQVRKTIRTVSGYNDYFFGKDGKRILDFKDGGKIDVDYINGKTEIANLLSRFLKGSIGQVSNPNYYLKAATNYYVGSRGFDKDLLRLQEIFRCLQIQQNKVLSTSSLLRA